jgi:restriction system protein
MSIPTYDSFIHPLLSYLGKHPEGVLSKDGFEAMASYAELDDETRHVRLKGGQLVYKNRVGWAHDRIKRAGWSTSPRRGLWKITDSGIQTLKNHPNGLDEETLWNVSRTPSIDRLKPNIEQAHDTSSTPPSMDQSPAELIENAVQELRDTMTSELLTLVSEHSPEFFEKLVLDVLHAIGYGTSTESLKRTGQSGDGGIDGIIHLDKLGLEKVYVQAKRWQGSVGRPAVQGFFGALAGRRAKKGVIITTSTFTREAKEFADSVSDSIVLVDGAKLGELMIDHQVGCSHVRLSIPKLDMDYFDQDEL